MAELRWNPLINDWVMVAGNRQNRPQMPKDYCPFCPSFGNVPEYDVLKYDNDFPALSQTPPTPDDVANDFFKVKPSYGKCEVILYSPDHYAGVKDLSQEHLEKLVSLWQERFLAISSDEKIKFVFIFENRGDVVGVTMPHPHGQIYGYSYLPKKLELEMETFKNAYKKIGETLISQMIREEKKDGSRIIFENEDFIVFLPFFSEYPYGIYIAAKRHILNISQFSDREKKSFADILKKSVGTLDSLFNKEFPYMMCMYNAPVNQAESMEYYHFHVAFYPPMRSADKQKFNASSETGAFAHCNPTCPELCAEELRQAYNIFLNADKN